MMMTFKKKLFYSNTQGFRHVSAASIPAASDLVTELNKIVDRSLESLISSFLIVNTTKDIAALSNDHVPGAVLWRAVGWPSSKSKKSKHKGKVMSTRT